MGYGYLRVLSRVYFLRVVPDDFNSGNEYIRVALVLPIGATKHAFERILRVLC